MSLESSAESLKSFIRDVPDFPKPGILFRDITPLLQSPEAFAACIDQLAAATALPDAIVAVESRGFMFGAGLALRWRVPFVPARKFGKLPGQTVREVYALEYGDDSLELHADALRPGARVVIVDDLLATGGTAAAAVALLQKLGANILEISFLIEMSLLKGREKLEGLPVKSIVTY